MVENKLAAVVTDAGNEAKAEVARENLEQQVAELRAEISRLTESVSAIGSGATAVVRSEAELVTEKVRRRVRDEPVQTLLAVAGASFLFGLLARR